MLLRPEAVTLPTPTASESACRRLRLHQILHQLLVAPRHVLRLARAAAADDVEADRAKAGGQCAPHVGALVVADVEDLVCGDAERVDGVAEDFRARLRMADVHGVDRRG